MAVYGKVTRKELEEYLRSHWDVTLEELATELEIHHEELSRIRGILEEFEEEGWLLEGYCEQHKSYEYSPAPTEGLPST